VTTAAHRPLLRLLLKQRRHLLAAAASSVVLAVATGLYATLVGPLLAFLYSSGSQGYTAFFALIPFASPEGLDRSTLSLILPGVVLVVAAVKGVAYYHQMCATGRAGQALARQLRVELFATVTSSRRRGLERFTRGDIATRLGEDVESVQQGVIGGAGALVREGLTLLALLSLCFYLDAALALLAFVVLPLACVPIVRFSRRLRRRTFEGQTAQGRLAGWLVETLANRDLIRAEAARQSSAAAFEAQARQIEAARVDAIRTKAISHPVMEFLGVGGLAATLWFASFRIWSGALQPADFVSFFAAVLMVYEPLKGISRAVNQWHEAIAAYSRIHEILSVPLLEKRERQAGPLGQRVTLVDVRFQYGDTEVLAGLSCEIRLGETLVISGPSGAGKSTLLRLIAGLDEPQGGRVTWDGADYCELDQGSLLGQVGYLDQEARCFSGSVRDNLTLGAPLDDAALWQSLEFAGASEFVRARGGLDSTLFEAADDLSGGQRRRLALARALAPSPSLLLLDEPTEAVDAEMESAMLDALKKLSGRLTIVIVSHRPQAIPWADRGLLLAPDGAVRELVGTLESEALSLEGEAQCLAELAS